MKRINVIYWTLTGLFTFVMLGSAIPDILVMPIAVEGFRQMGMPIYLVPFLGYAKLLGVIAVLVPGYPRLKEWAYAGLMFDLIGAIYSVANSGEPLASWAPMFLFVAIGFLSYAWYHKRRKAIASKRDAQIAAHFNRRQNEKAEIANAAIG